MGLVFVSGSAKDAIKLVDDKGDRMVKVSMSEDWLKARQESSNIHKIVHKFDWTYSPYDYRGTTTRTRNGQVWSLFHFLLFFTDRRLP